MQCREPGSNAMKHVPLFLLFAVLSAARNAGIGNKPSEQQALDATGSNSFGSQNSQGTLYVDGTGTSGYASITAALAALAGGPGDIYVKCGTYTENPVISASFERIRGQGVNCVFVQPAKLGSPVFTLQTTSNGRPGISYDEISDMTILCPAGSSCTSDGILFEGTDPNDWHYLHRLMINGPSANHGFQNGININGRTIWTVIENVQASYQKGDGLHSVTTSAIITHVKIRDSRFNNNQNYGINWSNNKNPALNINFEQVNAEGNGLSKSTNPCADVYINGIGSGSITGGYYENGCVGNPNGNTAEIRLTGTYAQDFDIRDNVLNAASAEFWDVYDDAVQATGMIEGNRNGRGRGIGVATSNGLSNVQIGENFNVLAPIVTPDKNKLSHVTSLSPFALPVFVLGGSAYPISESVIDLTMSGHTAPISNIAIEDGPGTVNKITGGMPGQFLWIRLKSGGAWTFTNNAGGTGTLLFYRGTSRVLASPAEAILLSTIDGVTWREVALGASEQNSTLQSVSQVTTNSNQTYKPGAPVAVTNLTKSITMPSTGGPFRAFVCYGVYWTTTTSAVTANAWITDGRNAFATSQAAGGTSSVPTSGNQACAMSTTSGYESGATVTFTVQFNANQNLTINMGSANSGGSASWLNVSIIPSVN
jgi:hypothetical protein